MSPDDREVKVSAKAEVEIGETKVAEVGVECAAGVTPSTNPEDPFARVRAKITAEIPKLADLPVIGKYFKTEHEFSVEIGISDQVKDNLKASKERADQAYLGAIAQ